jgi:hypothetical protein
MEAASRGIAAVLLRLSPGVPGFRAVKNFSLHFRRLPDALTFEDVRDYQLHLVSRGLEATTRGGEAIQLRAVTP